MRFAVLTIIVPALLADCGGDGGTAPSPTTLTIQDRLGSSNRDRLAICVDALGPADLGENEAVATEQVGAALEQVSKHENWTVGNISYSDPPPVVEAGCPAPPAFSFVPGTDPLVQGHGREVTEPSHFSLFVFVLTTDNYQTFGSTAWTLTTEQSVCDGGDCRQVTAGLYIAIDSLENSDFVVDALEKALGLEAEDAPVQPG